LLYLQKRNFERFCRLAGKRQHFLQQLQQPPIRQELGRGFMADAREKVKNVFAEAKTEPYAKSEA
jgi:hypothetical protein